MPHPLQPCRGQLHPRKRRAGSDAVIGAYTQRLASSQHHESRVTHCLDGDEQAAGETGGEKCRRLPGAQLQEQLRLFEND